MEWKSIAPWNWFRKEQERDVPRAAPLRRGDPFEALHQEMDRVLDGMLQRWTEPGGPSARFLDAAVTRLRPSLDISESRKAYTLRVEVPGVEKVARRITVKGKHHAAKRFVTVLRQFAFGNGYRHFDETVIAVKDRLRHAGTPCQQRSNAGEKGQGVETARKHG